MHYSGRLLFKGKSTFFCNTCYLPCRCCGVIAEKLPIAFRALLKRPRHLRVVKVRVPRVGIVLFSGICASTA